MTDLDGPRGKPAASDVVVKDGDKVLLGQTLARDPGNFLVPLLAPRFPTAAFVAPNAPQPCEINPFGFQWFPLENRDPHLMAAGADDARRLLDPFITAELEALDLDDSALGVIGFSQGTMMALHTLLRRPQACAALVGFSGRLIAPDRLAEEIAARPPVQLIHGEEDQVVPFGEMAAAEAGLIAAGITPKTLARPGLGHGIDPEGLETGAAFLSSFLGGAPAENL